MAHLTYPDLNAAEMRPLVDRIIAERGGVLHLYQMLMHSPPLADGWLTYLTAVRQKLRLSGALRELVIMRVAVLNGAPYEAEQHAPIALEEGLSQAHLDALGDWAGSPVFSAVQRTALELADVMTRDIQVPRQLIDQVRGLLGERETVELVATIAAYNMVSRFLEALHVRQDDARTGTPTLRGALDSFVG